MARRLSAFHITVLVLLLLIGYSVRFDLLLFSGFGYALLNKAAGQQLIGEYYHEKARFNRHKAYLHHRAALNHMVEKYDQASEAEKGPMAHLIASNFECGKGTAINLEEAKKWYKKSQQAGFQEANQALERLNKK